MIKKILLGACAAIAVVSLASCGKDEDNTSDAKYTKQIALVDGTDTAGTTWDPVTAASEVERVLTSKGNEVDVILSNNDGMALGIITNATYKQHNLPIFGVDALADAIQGIKDGKIHGTIKNDSYTQAGVTLQLAKNLIEGKDIYTDITDANYKGIYTNAEGKVQLEEGTKALRVHHQMITKANVNTLVTPESVTGNTLGEEGSELKVFALTYQNSDPNMSGLWKPGFNDFGKKLGMHVNWVDGAGDDKKAQEAVQAAAADTSYDAFLINPVDNNNGTAYINALKATGKPIIFWNREIPAKQMNVENVYYVGIESAEGGRLQGQMAAEYIMANGGLEKFDRNKDGKIGYIVVRGEKGHPDAEARTIASPENLEKYIAQALAK